MQGPMPLVSLGGPAMFHAAKRAIRPGFRRRSARRRLNVRSRSASAVREGRGARQHRRRRARRRHFAVLRQPPHHRARTDAQQPPRRAHHAQPDADQCRAGVPVLGARQSQPPRPADRRTVVAGGRAARRGARRVAHLYRPHLSQRHDPRISRHLSGRALPDHDQRPAGASRHRRLRHRHSFRSDAGGQFRRPQDQELPSLRLRLAGLSRPAFRAGDAARPRSPRRPQPLAQRADRPGTSATSRARW